MFLGLGWLLECPQGNGPDVVPLGRPGQGPGPDPKAKMVDIGVCVVAAYVAAAAWVEHGLASVPALCRVSSNHFLRVKGMAFS